MFVGGKHDGKSIIQANLELSPAVASEWTERNSEWIIVWFMVFNGIDKIE